jgi:hypothetical protein
MGMQCIPNMFCKKNLVYMLSRGHTYQPGPKKRILLSLGMPSLIKSPWPFNFMPRVLGLWNGTAKATKLGQTYCLPSWPANQGSGDRIANSPSRLSPGAAGRRALQLCPCPLPHPLSYLPLFCFSSSPVPVFRVSD